jgi:DNA-binding transcriptional LysR family regulator
MDVDTRLLRYFAAVAAEGNLTRAAERLFVSQPALTKQIKQLESQLGMRLFIRSRAGMTLTPAGQALADRTAAVLAGWDQALRETKATASRADRVLRVGFMSSAANEATQQIIAAFARRRPGWRVDMQQAAWSDPTAGLASGEVDAALLRLPFPGQDDVRIEVLLTEPRWVALPATHPLATHDQICFHQLWGRALRRRPHRERLVARLLAGHRRTPGPPGPHRIRHRPARRLADRDRQRIRHRPGPRIRRPLLRAPRHHLPARHWRQPEPGRGRLAAR